MKTLNRISLTLAFCLAATICHAQNGSVTASPQSNAENSSTSASSRQVEYQLPQPSLVTGAVNFNIPLYTIDVEGFSLPFSLSYQSSGIKPFDDPFPCGYGWTIQPALKITRTVRGRPDEFFDLFNDSTGELNLSPSNGFACMFNGISTTTAETQKRFDTENDIFKIALPSGIYTRIAFRESDGRYTFVGGNDDNEITIETDPTYPNFMQIIKVTDEKGVIYRFGGPYESATGILNEDNFNSQTNRTAWCLKEIELPSGRKIEFKWKTITSEGLFISGGDNVLDSYNMYGYHPVPFEVTTMSAMSGFYLNGEQTRKRLQLSSVSFPGGEITFSYVNEQLTCFEVAASGNKLQRVDLSYGIGKINKDFLTEVSITGKGVYKFEYNDCNFNDPQERLCQDWWGYYNGRKPQGNNYTLTPLLKFKCYETAQQSPTMQQIGYADRRPDEKSMQAGLLKMATYPTGAATKFEYETHRFNRQRVNSFGNISDDTDPYIDMGGGLRVKRIVSYISDSDSLEHRYSYDSVAVVAVPSAATFVSEMYTLGLPPDAVDTTNPFILRLLSFGYQSDYMRNHIGLDAIWYPKVTEYFAEGKIEYTHERLLPADAELRQWGICTPQAINNALGKGARLTCKKTYKASGKKYDIVETQSYRYELTEAESDSRFGISNGYVNNSRGTRILVQNAFNELQGLDFTDGKTYTYYLGGTYCYWDLNKIVTDNMDWSGRFWTGSPYRFYGYSLALKSDRLKSIITTRHLENGDFTQTETYEYKPGTSIVTSVATTTSNDTRTNRIDLTYASSTGSAAEKGMVAANMTGIPVKTKHTFGTATTTISHEMANFGNRVYLPSKTYQQRGTNEKWLVGEYTYDSYGNITEYKGEDGIPTSYLWGYGSLHPVYKILGAGYSQVKALNPGSNALNGSAELTDLASKLAGWLTTKVLWKPLVGIASQRSPDGLTSTYEYDAAGRLVQTAVNGHGPVSAYTYHINEDGYNYTTGAVFKSASATATVREVTNYDGLGRESSRLTKSTQQRLTVERAVSLMPIFNYYATLTEYDAMDRPYRQWATVPSSDMHPSAETVTASAKNLYGTDFAYVTTLYEASPAGTVTGSINSGTEWHDNNRRKTVRRLTNATSGDYSCYRLTLNGTTLSRSLYGKSSLLIEETTDEEGHVSMTFTDCAGRTVMTREGTPGNWYDTRYVYNDYGDLLAVLQPMSDQTKTTIQSEWAFTYKYDNRGRCVEKTIPGAVAVSYVYDNGGRLFAEQDGVMASRGEWLLHFYDRFGRDAFSAVTTATASQITAASDNIYTATPPAATSNIANASGGYSVNGNFALNLTTLDKALYYDNYDFGGRCSWIQSTVTSPLSAAAVSKSDVRGMQTGSYSEGRVSAVYYDDMSQPCVTREGKYTQQWPDYGTALIYDYEGKKSTEAQYSFAPTREAMQRTDFTYFDNGQLKGLTVTQGRDTATAVYTYDDTGRVCDITYGGNMKREMAYDVHGWLTSAQFTVPNKFQLLATLPSLTTGRTVHSETLYYADAPSGSVPRFDGKIASRTANGDFTAYTYDNHGRLTSAKSVTMKSISGEIDRDYSTSYTYDKNANLTSIFRKGIVDIIGGETRLFGTHTDLYFNYKGNQITGLTAVGQGADYEGRTGLGNRTPGSRMAYDANGNLNVDETRNIVRIKYNRQNLPTEITFGDGHRQTITYNGFGRKLRTDYSQVPEGMLVGGMVIYEDKHYELTSTREYVGPYVFTDGKLEYSAFAGGYFNEAGDAMYYVTDWQGNNVAVVSNNGLVVQNTIYYPYGEPTIEPTGQRYLFAGKEREHAGGRNSYDFGARCLTPYGRWGVPDSEAESFYPYSPYTYCVGDPINYVDPDGNIVNGAAGVAGGIGGAILGGGIELIRQVWSKDESISLSKIAGAAMRGAITGATAGITLGTSLVVTATAAAGANVIGGTVDRAIQGEETTVADVAIDATIGATAGVVGHYGGRFVKNWADKLSNKAKGAIGETVTRVKYGVRGYKSKGKYKVKTGGKTLTGREAEAHYDFKFKNVFTGKYIARESKFNGSGLTPNQKAAWNKAEYPIEIDRTTSDDLKNWTNMFIQTSAGASR